MSRGNVRVIAARAFALYKKGDAAAALAAYREAVNLDPYAPDAVYNAALLELAGGDAATAAADLDKLTLGKPDDWSFTTKGRVWLNQNWGCDALMYAAFKAGGEGGLLALKALMLLAIAGVAVAAARRRGAGWTPAILVVAAAMAVTRYQMELRASLATFLMARLLLLVLYQSGRRQRLIWLAVPLVAVWSALHGGYTLGLVFRCV